MVIVQTPLRISFFGGGTDYPVWFREHGGAVLATTIDKYIFTSCRRFANFHAHKHRIIYSKMEDVQSTDEIQHPAVRGVFKYLSIEDGLELHHDSDIPARSGMGSSSSFVVGLLHALHTLRGRFADKERLARESIHVEQEVLRENVGCQDQVMAAYGGFNYVLFNRDGSFSVQPVILKPERNQELQSHLMLFYTGRQRVASQVAADQIKNTPERTAELKEMRQMVEEGINLLGGKASLAEFGRLLDESWKLKRQLSHKISTSEIDEIYDAGMRAGAVGGKLLGAGGGGFMLFVVPPEQQKNVTMRLRNLTHVPFAFENLGSNIIFYRQQAVA